MGIDYCDPATFNALLFLRREQGPRRISWRAVGLGMVIAGFADKDTGEAWPSRATLSAITGIDKADISNTSRELRDAGFLTIEERPGRATVYRLTRRRFATGGDLPLVKPVGDPPPTRRRNTPKPVGDPPPITIIEQLSNNLVEEEEKPAPEPTPLKLTSPSAKPGTKAKASKAKSKAKQPGGKKAGGRPKLEPHPVLLEWNGERKLAGMRESVVGKQNNDFAAKLKEAVPDCALRRRVIAAFFARKNDAWLVEEGFVFYQLVNYRLDQCLAAAETDSVKAASPLQDNGSLGYLGYKLDRIEAKYGEDVARRYDSKAREFRSTIRADEWLEREVACPTA